MKLIDSSSVIDDHLSEDSASSGVASEDDEILHKVQKEQAWFASLPDRASHEKFLRRAVDLMLERAVFASTSREAKVKLYS